MVEAFTKPGTNSEWCKRQSVANFDFVVEDYRGFDISKGVIGNPTIGIIGQGSNK